MTSYLDDLFSLRGQVAVVTGGSGSLGSALAVGLARAGAAVGVLGRDRSRAATIVAEIEARGGQAMPLSATVLEQGELEAAREVVLTRFGRITILVCAAGGNLASATVPESGSFFDVPADALRQVIDLNLLGTVLPCRVFGEAMARSAPSSIVTISSLAARQALSRVGGYAVAKAGVEGFTRWLAVDLARTHGATMRVNCLAPGFFLAEQNRDLLLRSDETLTDRGQRIVDLTPARRFGDSSELIPALIWLCSPQAAFVTGTVVTVDGGFSAASGV